MAVSIAEHTTFWVFCGIAATIAFWIVIDNLRSRRRDPDATDEKERVARAELAWTIVALALLIAIILIVVGNSFDA